jgi:hypothetical protein
LGICVDADVVVEVARRIKFLIGKTSIFVPLDFGSDGRRRGAQARPDVAGRLPNVEDWKEDCMQVSSMNRGTIS